MKFTPFDLEYTQSVWEQKVEFNLTESGVHPITLQELIGDDPDLLNRLLQLEIDVLIKKFIIGSIIHPRRCLSIAVGRLHKCYVLHFSAGSRRSGKAIRIRPDCRTSGHGRDAGQSRGTPIGKDNRGQSEAIASA